MSAKRRTLRVGEYRGGILAIGKALAKLSLTGPDREAVRALGVGAWDVPIYTAHVLAIASGYLPEYCYVGAGPAYGVRTGAVTRWGVWPFAETVTVAHSTGGRYCGGEIAGGRESATAEDCYALEESATIPAGKPSATLYRRMGRGNRWARVWTVAL